jgi:SAM-dependent methyltransferase
LLAKNSGFEVEAIEMDSGCCEFLSDELGIRAYHSASVVETMRSLGRYDVVAFWHSIEHLQSPWDVLTEAFSHLNPNGIVVVATPNPNAFQFKVLRSWWTHLDAPRHLFLLPTHFLRMLSDSHGLQEVLFTVNDPDSREITRWGWAGSLVALANSSEPLVMLGRIIGVVAAQLMAVFERGSRSAAYTVVYRKNG